MNEVQLSSDINVITAEINGYKEMAGRAIFEIGRRLKYVKENNLQYGEWSEWSEEVIGMDRAKADKFIRVFGELGANELMSTQKGLDALYQIATLPPEERETTHETSSGETKTPNEMTVKELREVKRKLKEEEEQRKQVEQERDNAVKSEQIALKQAEEEANKEPEVVEKVVYQKDDSLQSEIDRQQKELKRLADENEQMKKRMKAADVKKEEFDRLEKNIKNLSEQRNNIQKDIEDAEEIMKYVVKIEEIKSKGMSPVVYSHAIQRQKDSSAVINRLEGAITSTEEWCKDMRNLLSSENNVIDAEVVE